MACGTRRVIVAANDTVKEKQIPQRGMLWILLGRINRLNPIGFQKIKKLCIAISCLALVCLLIGRRPLVCRRPLRLPAETLSRTENWQYHDRQKSAQKRRVMNRHH